MWQRMGWKGGKGECGIRFEISSRSLFPRGDPHTEVGLIVRATTTPVQM